MAKFLFNMQSLLNIKEKLEEKSKTEYGEAIAALEREKEIKVSLEYKKQTNIEKFKTSIGKGISPKHLESINVFIDYVDTQLQKQDENIKIAEKNVEEKRLKLLDAMKEKKALEKLKEKKQEEYFREELKNEQKIIDEIVSFKYSV